MSDLDHNDKIAALLHFIAEKGQQSECDDESFFQGVVSLLARLTAVEYAFISAIKKPEETTVNTIALYARGSVSDNIQYELQDSPCETVYNNRLCVYEENVAKSFPKDKLLAELDAESYVGVPLWDSSGAAIGLVVLIGCGPMADTELAKTLLQIVAVRVGFELERIWKDQEIKQSEEKYRHIFENAFDAVFLVKQSSRQIIDTNRSASEMLGYSHEQFCKMQFQDLFEQNSEDDDPAWQQKLLQNEKPRQCESVQLSRDGSRVPVDISANLDVLGGEPVTQYYVRDLRARKQLEEQLIHSQKMEAVGTLAGGIAHDFNNVLMGVLGFAELAARECRDTSVSAKLGNIIDSCQHGCNIVSKILSFSRKLPEQVSILSLPEIIENAVEILRASFPTSVCINVKESPSDINVQGDLTQLERIIVNICTNAVYALKNRTGTITIELTTRALNEQQANVLGLKATQYASLKIADDGVGMSEAVRRRIFEPFFTTKKPGEGTGLGLSIVHGIVHNHYGSIQVESEVGIGTTFTIFLPLNERSIAEQRMEEAMKEKDIDHDHVGGGKVLVVDDDPKVLMILEEALKLFGYQPVACSSGIKALNLFKESPETFTSVITDQAMPGMSGDQLIKEIRKVNDSVPIILCTGYADLSAEEWESELDLFACLKKPFTMAALSDVLAKISPRR